MPLQIVNNKQLTKIFPSEVFWKSNFLLVIIEKCSARGETVESISRRAGPHLLSLV